MSFDGKDKAAKPTPEVGYVVVKQEAVPLRVELPGRTAAYETSEVRPQVSGIIQARLFTEGAQVKAGDVLYRIDPRIYESAAGQARADLASAVATREAARAKADRFTELMQGMKMMATEMQRELETTRGELRRGILELPQETSESAAQMRRVIVDQIEALAELNRIVARHGRGLDAAEPARRGAEPAMAIAAGRPEPARQVMRPLRWDALSVTVAIAAVEPPRYLFSRPLPRLRMAGVDRMPTEEFSPLTP